MRKSMIFHCFPVATMDWKANCMAVFSHRDVFDGRVVVSISTGRGCDEAASWFEQFAPIEIKLVQNVRYMGLNVSFREQVKTVLHEEGIVFKAHTKGITHGPSDPCRQWRENMAKLCLGDIKHVEHVMSLNFNTYGPYRTVSDDGEAVVNHTEKRWKGWHYPGAFFWFKPSKVPLGFFQSKMHHYENEEFPCMLGPLATSYCPTPDNCDFRKPI